MPLIEQEKAIANGTLAPPFYYGGGVESQPPWVFLPENEPFLPEGGSVVANEYVCALYWALAAMTNLKGLPAHESRQCLILSPQVINRASHSARD